MRFAIVFLYLFAFLLKGSGYDHAFAQKENAARTPVSSGKALPHHSRTMLLKDAGTDSENEYIIADSDSEDDDSDNFSAGENALKPHCYAALPYLSGLLYRYKSFKAPPHLHANASHIYIFQRTLRI